MDIFLEGRKGNHRAALWIRSRTNSRTKTSCQTEFPPVRRGENESEEEAGILVDDGEEEMKRSERGEGMGWLKQAWCLIQRNWRHAPLTTQQATPSTSRKTGPEEEGREGKEEKGARKRGEKIKERKKKKKERGKKERKEEERRRDPLCPP